MDIESLVRHREFVRSVARSLLRDENRIDDVEQETFVAALRQPGLRPGGLRGWLKRVAGNFARKELRSEHRRREREKAVAGCQQILVDHVSRETELARAVLDLREPYRTTILLRFYQGLSPREIGARQQVPAGTVRSRLSRGLAHLRKELEGDHAERRREWFVALGALAVAPRPRLPGFPVLGGAVLMKMKAVTAAGILLALILLTGATWYVITEGGEGDGNVPPAARSAASPEKGAAGNGQKHGATVSRSAVVRVAGVVLDASTLHPVAGAHVIVSGIEITTSTGPDGAFSFEVPKAGLIDLLATAKGYREGEAILLDPAQKAEVYLVPSSRTGARPSRATPLGVGAWLGPCGEVPPGSRGPFDPAPPPLTGWTRRYRIPPASGSKARAPRKPPTFADWSFWWAFRGAEILARRTPAPPGRAALATEVAELLRKRLDSGTLSALFQPGALLALSVHGDGADAGRLLAVARSGADRDAVESAISCLGLLGKPSREVVEFLEGVLADPRWPTRMREYAVFSLGLLGRDSPEAARAVETSLRFREVDPDLTVAKVVALGSTGDRDSAVLCRAVISTPGSVGTTSPEPLPGGPKPPSFSPPARSAGVAGPSGPGSPRKGPEPPHVPAPSRGAGVPGGVPGSPPPSRPPSFPTPAASSTALEPMGGSLIEERLRAIASTALADVDPSGAPQILAVSGREGRICATAAVIALGRIDTDPGRVLALTSLSRDPILRRLGLIALGRIAARSSGSRGPSLSWIRSALQKGPDGDRSFAALALALAEDRTISDPLRKTLTDKTVGAILRGACAVSLGMLGDAKSRPLLLSLLEDPSADADLRGAAAEALGLMHASEATLPLERILVDPHEESLWRSAATALGLIGGDDAKSVLFSVLRSRLASSFDMGAAAHALARIASRKTVERLFAVLDDEGVPMRSRIMALDALARIADRRPIPLSAGIRAEVDYRAMCPFLDDLLLRLP